MTDSDCYDYLNNLMESWQSSPLERAGRMAKSPESYTSKFGRIGAMLSGAILGAIKGAPAGPIVSAHGALLGGAAADIAHKAKTMVRKNSKDGALIGFGLDAADDTGGFFGSIIGQEIGQNVDKLVRNKSKDKMFSDNLARMKKKFNIKESEGTAIMFGSHLSGTSQNEKRKNESKLPNHLEAAKISRVPFSLNPQASQPVNDDPMSALWAQVNQHRVHRGV
jgi:hypothetical protein